MTTDENTPTVPAHLVELCEASDVVFAVAFGSRVSGDATPASDFDLAVKFDDDCSDRTRFDQLCRLSGQLQADDAPFVDVSDLDRLPLSVARDAANGMFVCGDEDAFDAFCRRIETAAAHRHDERRDHHRSVIDRIADEGLRG